MKKRIFAAALIFALLIPVLRTNAFAGSATMRLRASAEHVEVGDTVTVTVTFSASEGLDVVYAGITYDGSRLKYISGGGNDCALSGGTGGIYATGGKFADSFEYSFTFLAYKEGTAYFRLSDCEAISYDTGKNILGTSTGRAVIVVGKSSGEPEEPKPSFTPSSVESAPAESVLPFEQPGNLKLTVDNAEYDVIDDDSLAGIMSKSQYVLEETNYPSWKGSSEYILLHSNSGRLLYDVHSQALLPAFVISEDVVLFPSSPAEEPALEKTSVTVNGLEIEAYRTDQNEFLLVYCESASGESGWYFYDTVEKTFQPAYEIAPDETAPPTEDHSAKPSPGPEATPAGSSNFSVYALIAVIIIAAVLLALIIITAARGRR